MGGLKTAKSSILTSVMSVVMGCHCRLRLISCDFLVDLASKREEGYTSLRWLDR